MSQTFPQCIHPTFVFVCVLISTPQEVPLADLHAIPSPYRSFKSPISVGSVIINTVGVINTQLLHHVFSKIRFIVWPPWLGGHSTCLLPCTRFSFPSIRREQPSMKSPIPIRTSSWGPTAETSSGSLAVIPPRDHVSSILFWPYAPCTS